jgi:hypothetical protein
VVAKAPKQFTDTLRDIRGGQLTEDLTERLRELVSKVNETGGGGSLTLTLKIKRAAKGSGMTLIVADDIKVKLPVGERGETILFATDDGELQRNDPRQPRLVGMETKPTNVTPIGNTVSEAAAQS